MTRHSNLLWSSGLGLGLLLDALFWRQSLGVNFTLYSVICIVVGFLLLRMNRQRPALGALWLLPFILILSAVVSLRAEPLTIFLSVLSTLFLMLILSNTFLGGRWFRYGLLDHLNAILTVAINAIGKPLSFQAEVRKEQAASGTPRRSLRVWPYVRGVLFAAPILVIFASLLASADPVFGNGLSRILSYLSIENLPDFIFQMILILLAGYLVVGVFLHASVYSASEKLIGEDRPLAGRFVGFTEAAIVLGSVAVLFATFVAIQFRYFFGGQANITVAGYTYAEYARRGFGELITVAFFSLLLILGLGNATRREGAAQRWWFSGLSLAVVALVFVMLVSAYQRLVLYENAYGFSRLRTYTHAALIWIGLLLGAVVILEILQVQRAFTLAALLASLGFVITLSVLNVDAFIVKENVQRANEGNALDVPYLVSLSTDYVPGLVDAFESRTNSGKTRDSAGAVLFCRLQHEPATGSGDWRSFTLSKWRADRALQRVQGQLAGYHVVDDTWPVKISTPAGDFFWCYEKVLD